MLNDTNHPALLQKQKLKLDDAAYEEKIDANVYKPSFKKEIDPHDSNYYWPTPIKETIHWFTFFSIMEHTAIILEPNKPLIPSLLKAFAMFKWPIFYDKYNEGDNFVEAIAIKCINCNKDTGLYSKDTTIEEMITKFVLNSILHHVGVLHHLEVVCNHKLTTYDIQLHML